MGRKVVGKAEIFGSVKTLVRCCFFPLFLCQNILQQEQVSFHDKRHASALSAFLHDSDSYVTLQCLLLGSLPREKKQKLAYVLDLP